MNIVVLHIHSKGRTKQDLNRRDRPLIYAMGVYRCHAGPVELVSLRLLADRYFDSESLRQTAGLVAENSGFSMALTT